MFGVGKTVKPTPLLANPLTVTTTFPVVAPAGTGTVMNVGPQFVGEATVPLNMTVLVPSINPKPVPAIDTEVPAIPDVGFRLVMVGVTVKFTLLLANPPTATTTGPVVAPVGTGTKMLVALQLVGIAVVPLHVTVLATCVGP